MKEKAAAASCEICMYYSYDEEYKEYNCEIGDMMDEDDVWQMMSGGSTGCPYFRMGNEYSIVRKQI